MKRLSILVVLFLCISQLSAATYYLDAINGSDSTGNGSTSAPWASMSKAFTVVSPGDTVLLRPGNYGSVAFAAGSGLGDATGDVTYMADPATTTPRASTWFEESLTRPDPANPNGKVIFSSITFNSYVENFDSGAKTGDPVGHYVTLEGLNIVGGRISLTSYVSHVTIRDCNIFGNWAQFSSQLTGTAFNLYRAFELGSNYRHILIEDCYASTCGGGVMLLGNFYDVTIRGCHIHDVAGTFISMQGGSKEQVTIEGNHVHHQMPVADTVRETRSVVTPDASEPDRIFTVNGSATYWDFVVVTDADDNTEEVRAVASFNTSTYEVVLAESLSFDVEAGDTVVFWDGSHGSGLSIRAGNFTFRGNRIHDCGATRGIYVYDVDTNGCYPNMIIENNLVYCTQSQYTVDFNNGIGDNCVIRNNTFVGHRHSNYYTNGEANLYYGFGMVNCGSGATVDTSTITIANNLIVGQANAPSGAIVKNNIVFASVGSSFEEDSIGDNADNIVYYHGESAGNEPHPFDGSGNYFVGGGLFDTQAFTIQSSENFNAAFQIISTSDPVGYGNISLATSVDITDQTRDMTPDTGAYECDSPGSNGTIADAGDDQTIEDEDDNGSETVQLDGSGSVAKVGTIVSYVWTENSSTIATGATPSISLGVGTHEITLTITDSNSFYDTDVVIITIEPMETELLIYGDLETSWGYYTNLGSDVTRPVVVDSSPTSDWETIMVGDWVRESAGNWNVSPSGTGNDSAHAAGLRKTYGTAQVLEDNIVTAGTTLLLNWDYHVPTGLTVDTVFTVRLFGVNEAAAGEAPTQFNNFSTTVNNTSTVSGESWNYSEISNMSVTVDYDDATNGTWQSAATQQITLTEDWDYLVVIFGRRAGTGNIASIQMDNISLELYTQSNYPPVADAGSDQSVEDTDNSGSESVQLNGSGSSDSDGTISSYVWTEGATQIATGATPTVNLSVGTHSITLTVTDDDSATDSDTVEITVTAGNSAPVADAGSDQTVSDSDSSGSESVQLNGSGSSDSDGTISSYVWTEGATQIATGATPTVLLSVGTHTITLTVIDDDSATDSDTVVITVNSSNTAPVADAGSDQTVNDSDASGSESVQLDGSGSSDSDGSIVSYVWTEGATQIATGATPTVTLSVGTHTITLTVTDDDDDTDTDTVEIAVINGSNLLTYGGFETYWGYYTILGSDVTRPVTVDSSLTSDWETIMIEDWVRESAGNWLTSPSGTGNDSDKVAALRKPYGTVQSLPLGAVVSGDTLELNWDYHVPTGLAADTTFSFRLFGVNEAGSGEAATQFNNFSTTINNATTVTGETSNFDEIFNTTLTVDYDDATNGVWQSASPSQISIQDDWDYLVLIFGAPSCVLNVPSIQVDNISLAKIVPAESLGLEGDIDGNGSVNMLDFLILKSNYGSNDATYEMGDLNYDGVVNIMDFLILKANYGK